MPHSWQMRDCVGPPWSVQIGLTEGCNRLCGFCGINAIRDKPGKYQFMDMRTVHIIGVELARLCPTARIEFALHGEPTMHPKYLECISKLRWALPKAQIMMTTNGARYMRGRMTQELPKAFEAGLDFIMLDTYRDVRDELMFQVRGLPEHGIAVRDYYDCVRDKVPLYGRNGLKRTVVVVDDISERSGEHSSRTISNHAGNNPSKPRMSEPRKATCTRPYRELSVFHNGDVLICCHDWKHEQVMGHIYTRSLFSIWNGERFDAVRAMLSAKDRSMSPCRFCDERAGPRVGILPKYSPPTAEQRRLLNVE
jgi:hypothetical protein